MTVSSTLSRKLYAGDDSTTSFPTTFEFLLNGDLQVILRGTDNVETVLTETTHYTLTGAGNDAGGTVVMITPPATGEVLVLQRVTAKTQGVDYVPNDPFPAETHESALDRLTLIAQESGDDALRAIVAPVADTDPQLELPAAADRANKFPMFDADGNVVVSTGTGADAGLRADLANFTAGTPLGNNIVSIPIRDKGETGVVNHAFAITNPRRWNVIYDGQTTATDNKAAIDAMLASGNLEFIFEDGVSWATTGLHAVPDGCRIHGGNSDVVPLGNPAYIWGITPDDTDAIDNTEISHFELSAACTYFIKINHGNYRFGSIHHVKVTGGAGTAIVYANVTSTTKPMSRNKITDIDARVSGWDNAVLMDRSAAALAANIGADNITIERINHWADVAVVDIGFTAELFTVEHIYGGLFAAGGGHHVVKMVNDDTTKSHRACKISQIHMEAWENNSIALEMDYVDAGCEISNIIAIRVAAGKTGLRAIKLANTQGANISSFSIREVNQGAISGFYPAIELAPTCHDNFITMKKTDYAFRVTDNGYRNIFHGIKNDKYLYATTDRITNTGIIATPTVAKTFTIPADTLDTADGIRIIISGSSTGAGSKKFALRLDDGTTDDIVTQLWDTPAAPWRMEVSIWNVGASSQRTDIVTHWNGVIVAQTQSTEAQDFTSDVEVKLEIESIATGGDIVYTDLFTIEPIYKVL